MKDLRRFIRQILLENECPVPKAIFMAGGPGSGKSTVLRELGLFGKIKIINPDDAYEAGLKSAGIPLDRDAILTKYKPLKDAYLAASEAGDHETVDRLEPEYSRLRSILSQNMKIFTAARKGAKADQEEATSCREDFLVDGTAGDFRNISRQIKKLSDSG